jgi:hypothetical protein
MKTNHEKNPTFPAARDAPEDPLAVALGAKGDREISREQLRSRRKRDVRARSISVKRLPKRDLALGKLLFPDRGVDKPATRGACKDGARPCPFISCKHHLYLDVSARTGAIKLNFPDLEIWEMTESCVLDVADRGSVTLEDVGAIMNVTRERVRQMEVTAVAKLVAVRELGALRDFVEEGCPVARRRVPVAANTDGGDDGDEDEPIR